MHKEALTKEGAALFPLLSKFDGFTLAGGTALALQIGHRISVDFDLFSKEEIPKGLLPKVKLAFKARTIEPSINNPDELTVFVDTIKITFLRYPFPDVDVSVTLGGLTMLSVKEIAATKAYTIGRRGAYKDYVDLYFILSQMHATLAEIIELAEKKFGSEFNSRLFLEQLIFLDDIEDTEIQFLKTPVTRPELIVYFKARIKELLL